MRKELPKGWEIEKLSEIAKLLGGFAFKSSDYTTEEKGVPIIRMGNLSKDFKLKWNPKKQVYFPQNKFEDVSKYELFENDLLICLTDLSDSGEYLGTVALMDKNVPALLNQRVSKFQLNEVKINKRFLFHQLCSPNFRKYMVSDSTGTLQKNTNHNYILNYIINFPSIPEQQRIVDKLDQIFSHLETAKKGLEKIPVLLKQFRQAVLTQAVTGKLTEDKKWKRLTIESITTKVGSGSTPSGGQTAYKESGIPLVRSMNIHFKGIKNDGLAFIDEIQAHELRNVTIEKDDVLLNITGASIGRVCLAENHIIGGRVNQHVSIIRSNQKIISPSFLNLVMSAPEVQHYINDENYGVTRQALTKSQLLSLTIPVPSLEEQNEIVRRVEALFSKADAIEARYKVLKEKIDNLPQAVLAKAFRGEL
jgi:type I restriction enzyme S subunit